MTDATSKVCYSSESEVPYEVLVFGQVVTSIMLLSPAPASDLRWLGPLHLPTGVSSYHKGTNMPKSRLSYYVGVNGGLREVHRRKAYQSSPSPEATPQYVAVIGPLRTLQAAKFMVQFGMGNPHCQTVADAERLAPQYAAELATLGESKRWY